MNNQIPAVKVTLEINQETNLEELMAHLCLMQTNMPADATNFKDELSDFSIHEGELEPATSGFEGF